MGCSSSLANVQAMPENHNPWRKRGTALAARHPSKVSQHALRPSGTCHPTPEIFPTRATFTRDAIPR